MKKSHHIAEKTSKNVNLGDKKSQTNVKNHKNVNLREKKLKYSVKKTLKWKFKGQKVTN